MDTQYTDAELMDILGFEPGAPPAPPAVAIEFHGRGGQQRARESGALYLLHVDQGGPADAFHGYTTAADRDAAAGAFLAAGLMVVERVDGARPARPYLDIDAPTGATDAQLAEIVDVARDVAASLRGAPPSGLDFVINACDRDAKRSRHIVADGWAVPSGKAVRLFADDVRRTLRNRAGSAHLADWVDRSGAPSSYGLRVAGCPKKRDTTATLDGPLAWLQTDGEPVYGDEGPGVRSELTPVEVEEARGFTSVGAVPVSAFLTEIDERFAGVYERAPDAVGADAREHGVHASYDRVSPTYCPACDRNHDRAGAYVHATEDGSLFFRCRRAPKGGPCLAKALARRASQPQPLADRYDDIGAERLEVVGGPGVYNREAVGDDGVSDLYVASAWGTGKSQHNVAIVKNLLERKPDAKVLIVSARKSLSSQLVKDLGATSYASFSGALDVRKRPITVWQVDSMARVPSDTRFDLIIHDEVVQTVAHAYGQENGGDASTRARRGMAVLRCLIPLAGRVILTDNDLTGAIIDAHIALRPGRPYRIVRNAFQPWGGLDVSLQHGPGSHLEVKRALFDFLANAHREREAGRSWSAAVVPCHSKEQTYEIANRIEELYGAGSVRVYTSEEDDHVKAHDFADATAAWGPEDGTAPRAVVYTSTVSVGVSCISTRFSHCFALFSSRGVAAAQSAQMLFRCRRLAHVLIGVEGPTRYDLPCDQAGLYEWATLARNRAAIPDEFRHDRVPGVEAPTASDPEALAEHVGETFEGVSWVSAMIEKHRSARHFVERLVRIIERAGIHVTTMETVVVVDEDEDELALALQKAAETAKAARSTRIAAAMPAGLERWIDRSGRSDETRLRTSEEKAGDRGAYILSSLRVSAEDVLALGDEARAMWVAAYEPVASRYVAAVRVASGLATAPGVANRGDFRAAGRGEADSLAREAFRVIGVDPAAEEGRVELAQLEAETVAEVAQRINQHATRIFDDSHGARRANTISHYATKPGIRRKTVVASLGVALKYAGAILRPQYDTARQEKQGTPARYALRRAWSMLPDPRPQLLAEAVCPAASARRASAARPPLEDADLQGGLEAVLEDFQGVC